MECFLLFEDGSGSLLLEDGTDFLLLESCDGDDVVALLGGRATFGQYPGIQGKNPWTPDDYEKAFKYRQLEETRERIVETRIEAQEVVLKKREILPDSSKQARRQLAALERKYDDSMAEIARLSQILDTLQSEIDRTYGITKINNDATMALMLSLPFFIGGAR